MVEETIARAAFRGERLLSLARAGFCLAILGRAVWVDSPVAGVRHSLVSIPSLLLIIGLSVYMVRRGRRHHHRPGLLVASSAVDAAACFTALAPNALWPVPGYAGIVRIPDTAALLIVTVASGLRLSPAAAAWAAGLNAVALALLVVIDVRGGHTVFPDHAGQLSLWAIYLAGAGVLALLVARRTRRLVTEGAGEAVIAEQTRRRLGELLQDHHDLRTALSSATLNADLMARAAPPEPEGGEPGGGPRHLDRLREDLRRAAGLVTAVRSEAAEETRALREPVPAAPAQAVGTVFAQLRPRFPQVSLSFDDRAPQARVGAGGGPATLERILLNLVLNACEGDGVQWPRRVEVAVEPSERPGWLRFSVSDDGPGFPAALLPQAGQRAASSKPEGAGIGLVLIAGLLRANGSRLECFNRDGGGAMARFELPLAVS